MSVFVLRFATLALKAEVCGLGYFTPTEKKIAVGCKPNRSQLLLLKKKLIVFRGVLTGPLQASHRA